MSVSLDDIENSKCLFVFGYNGADSHPIVARRIVKARQKGAKIVVCDPRKIETARIADQFLQLHNGSNMALINAFIYTLIEEELYDKEFVAKYTEGFDGLWDVVKDYAPEAVEAATGVPAAQIRQAMRTYAGAESAVIMWGMGVTQYGQGTETVKSLAALALLTGNLGRAGAGVAPVRGQNNVQGACDMGVLPDLFPGYQSVADPAIARNSPKPGVLIRRRWILNLGCVCHWYRTWQWKAKSKPTTSWVKTRCRPKRIPAQCVKAWKHWIC